MLVNLPANGTPDRDLQGPAVAQLDSSRAEGLTDRHAELVRRNGIRAFREQHRR
ncbi:hypothetical protein [Pseudonocardia sp. WMMC193]|uniref:hypothetical protein n=1 Tax=Pseudonocardia sp. WMMC193 TaxID=2911965 RepID=UPI001F1A1D62|nr:hypothetical protein [Pseudonocardia sp. WMMC193]MCF7552619.1 hypothetical protein [Pseudonocardia sp. WMMC193]